jgi:hypothetical protein
MELTDNIKRLLEVKKVANDMCLLEHFPILAKHINDRDYKRGIEIGVSYGSHSEYILSHCPRLEQLFGVDPYEFYLVWSGIHNQSDMDDMYTIALNDLSLDKRFNLIRKTSDDCFRYFQITHYFDDGVDFVFIDGDHSFEQVSKDIRNYSRLIKPGGLLCGHDYNNMPGVAPAVDEFAKSIGKKVVLEQGTVWVINY